MTDHQPRTPWNGRGRRSWLRRAGSAVGVLVLSLVLAVGLSLWSLDRNIDRVDVDGLGSDATGEGQEHDGDGDDDGVEASEAGDDAEPLTVLVLGSDSREDLTREEQAELGTGDAPGDRAEVIALARLSPEDQEVRMLNVPRDSYVERCDGSHGKINAAYEVGEADGRGGATCMVQTLTRLLDVSIDHVVRADFGGFVEVIDELGGVTMHLDQPLQDDDAHLDLPAGCVDLDGRDALAFVRARHIDDDYGRIARQHRLLEEVRAEVSELGILSDLPRAMRVAEAVAGSLELDSSLGLHRLQQLVREHRSTVRGGLDGRALPGEPAELDGAWILELDDERADELVSWLRTGVDPADGRSGATTDPTADGVADAGETDAGETDDATGAGDAEDGPVVGNERAGDVTRTLSGDRPAAGEPSDPEEC